VTSTVQRMVKNREGGFFHFQRSSNYGGRRRYDSEGGPCKKEKKRRPTDSRKGTAVSVYSDRGGTKGGGFIRSGGSRNMPRVNKNRVFFRREGVDHRLRKEKGELQGIGTKEEAQAEEKEKPYRLKKK